MPDAGSTRYRDPIRVTRNTVIRAAAFIGNERATHVITSSYFVNDTIALPILSLSLEPDEYAAIHNNSSGRGRATAAAWRRTGTDAPKITQATKNIEAGVATGEHQGIAAARGVGSRAVTATGAGSEKLDGFVARADPYAVRQRELRLTREPVNRTSRSINQGSAPCR